MLGWRTVLYGSPDTLRIVSYNVENLFDNRHDTLKSDFDFTPEGTHHWTYRRYQAKVGRIAQVLTAIGGWQAPVLVGLCEVENDRCLRSLCWHLRRYRYKYVHYESPDERGIDVALLYDSTRFHLLHSEPIPVPLPSAPTRDILYVRGTILPNSQSSFSDKPHNPTPNIPATGIYHIPHITNTNTYHTQPLSDPVSMGAPIPADTLHLFICHFPSQLGGTSETEWKRAVAKSVLQSRIDSLLTAFPSANVIVMGDMNSAPANDLIGMTNLMFPLANEAPLGTRGTHKYNGIWTFLDQFYISEALTARASAYVFAPSWLLESDEKYLGTKPRRTFNGYHYQDAYSDHLPVVLTIYKWKPNSYIHIDNTSQQL
ncbi:MAG TPA: hypothetical protein DIW30_03645 [Bacteroidales bacterium]|nr:hypothetical protein [Bacteroidales bacterium]